MSDLYERLGVSRGASTDEIRRAYKDLARVKHPDRGGDADEFKKIQEAHEVLADDDRRRVYDATGATSEDALPRTAGGIPFQFMGGMGPFGMPGVAFDMGDMFGHIFGGGSGGARRPRAPRGPNKHHDIGLALTDFYRGKEIKLRFNQARRCGSCNGSGAETTEQCGACKGSGVRTTLRQIGPGMMAQTRSPCDVCSGEGTRTMKVCRGCNGKRYAEREKQLDIKIEPGMSEGTQITFAGECSDGAEFEAPGDVVLTLRRSDAGVGELDEYEWRGDDLSIRKQISYAESLLGFTIALDNHPGGARRLRWGGGPLIHGAVLRYDGGGMPRRGGGYGTLYVQVMIAPPPTTPWGAEDIARLRAIFGGAAESLVNEGDSEPLTVHSAESALRCGALP
jgi:DnaJ-class molecular chaperone